MDGLTAAQREFASRLLAHEQPGESPEARAAASARVYEKLAACLSPLVGATGVRALFARSIALTSAEFPFLAAVSVEQPEAAVNTFRASLQGQAADAVLPGAAALFGAFLSLLATYVGERLTAQVLRTAWPELAGTSSAEASKETK